MNILINPQNAMNRRITATTLQKLINEMYSVQPTVVFYFVETTLALFRLIVILLLTSSGVMYLLATSFAIFVLR